MKRYILMVSRYCVMGAIFLFGAWYVYTHYDRFAAAAEFTVYNLGLLVAFNLLTIAAESYRLRLQIRKLGADIGAVGAWNMLTLIQAANHVILKAGTFSGGYYLSKRYAISFHAYVALVVTYVVIMTLGSGVFGLGISLVYILTGSGHSPLLLLIYVCIIAACAGFIAMARFRVRIPFAPAILNRLLLAWREIYSDLRLVVTLTVVEMVYFLFCAVRFHVAVGIFSTDISFLESVVVVTIGNFLRVASIVPGGLGVAELASGWTAGVLGVDAGISGLAAGFDRLIYVLLIAVFGGAGFIRLTGRDQFHRPAPDTPLR